MPNLRLITLNILLIAIIAAGMSGCGRDASEGAVLASYDGGSITEAGFRGVLKGLPDRVREVALRQKKDFLESYIVEKLLLREAESKGIQHQAEVDALVRQARDRILVTKLIEGEVESKSSVAAEEARAYYKNHKDDYVSPFRLKASHILLRSREEAEAMLVRLKQGESFEELARNHSLDPTASRGGDIGYFQKGQLIPEIEEAAFALEVGQMSGVVQSTFGFHILKVTGEAKPQVKEFELVREQIGEKLILEKKTDHFNALTERLKRKAKLEINEGALSAFEYERASDDPAG